MAGADHSDPDFDFIVIGSGFGGSVSAHRLAEKGYRVAVMEMGRRWKAEDFPQVELEDLAVDLEARPRSPRLLQYQGLPARADPARLRGWRRLHHLCQHAAGPEGLGVGQRLVGRTGGLEIRDAAAL